MSVYPNYKDSGVQWIGDIPSHWRLERAKFHFSERNERGNATPTLLAATQKYGMYPQELVEGVVKVADGTDMQQFKTVHVGDFVISLRSFQGGFERSDYEGVCSPAYQVFSADNQWNTDYLKFLFKNELFVDSMNSLTVGIREGRNIKYSDFANSILAIPPIEEQHIIADYLNKTVTHIDNIIIEAKASIEEYKAWKASIIYEAVTKGIDPNVEMKDSGVEWIGKMPSDCEIKQLSQLVERVKNKNYGLRENNLLSLSYGQIKRKNIDSSEGLLPESFEGYNIIEANDIVLRLTDLQNDHTSLRVGRSIERGIITSAYITIRPFDSKYSKYIYYLLHSFDIKKGFYGMGSGVRQGLNYDEVKNLRLPIPSYEKQVGIVKYLDTKCKVIEDIISEKEVLISDLESYKKSLIFEVVTGKRRVC